MRPIDADAFDKVLEDAQIQCRRNGGNFRFGVLSTVRANLENAPTVGGWISVSDRLPSEGDYRECHENWDGCVIWTNGSDIGLGWYSTITGDWADIYDCDIDDVTHWMPLPELPKEDDDEH